MTNGQAGFNFFKKLNYLCSEEEEETERTTWRTTCTVILVILVILTVCRALNSKLREREKIIREMLTLAEKI